MEEVLSTFLASAVALVIIAAPLLLFRWLFLRFQETRSPTAKAIEDYVIQEATEERNDAKSHPTKSLNFGTSHSPIKKSNASLRWIVIFAFAVSFAVGYLSNWYINGPFALIAGGVVGVILARSFEGWHNPTFDDIMSSPPANVVFWTIVGLAAIAFLANLAGLGLLEEVNIGRW